MAFQDSMELLETPRKSHKSRPGSSTSNQPLKQPAQDATSAGDFDAGQDPSTSRDPDFITETDGSNEHSLLLTPRSSGSTENLASHQQIPAPLNRDVGREARRQGDILLESKSSWYLFLLTVCMGGVQIAWSVELSYGSPYLLSLGLSKALLALVWIAGPLSGILVQPYIGIRSDDCRSRFGKRRPFIVGGGIATISSLFALAWAKDLVAAILGLFGVSKDSSIVTICSIVLAVLLIYVLDFAINVIQAAVRALIVDNAPAHQQDSANAWASRIQGLGAIVAYLFGYIDLQGYLWFFGDNGFKILCAVGSMIIAGTLAISCISIREKNSCHSHGDSGKPKPSVIAVFVKIGKSMRRLPPRVSRVCQVQFFAWIGWFPFLFYTTTYVGEIFAEPYLTRNPNMTDAEIAELWQRATSVGTFALFIFAIVTFVASVLLPFLVAHIPNTSPAMSPAQARMAPDATTTTSTISPSDFSSSRALPMARHPPSKTFRSRLLTYLPRSLRIPFLTLHRCWLLSHLLFVLLTWSTILIRTTTGATIFVALLGIPWAVTNWAPFALIAAEISNGRAAQRALRSEPQSSDDVSDDDDDDDDDENQAGAILGIHNVAIAAPQVVATLGSSVIFRLLQKHPHVAPGVGDGSVGWVLRAGGACALVAAWLSAKLGDA